MKLDTLLDVNLLRIHIRDGVVSEMKHPEHKRLAIYNYTHVAQHDNIWDNVTEQTRGLIVDTFTGEVLARPFRKFFNLNTSFRPETQEENLPSWKPRVLEKLDGCFLGNTKLNLWDGGTISIREIVLNKIKAKLVGMDKDGNLIPCYVEDWYNNGTKSSWICIDVDCPVSSSAGSRTGNHIPTTPNHSWFVSGKYKPASEIQIGDILVTQDLTPSQDVIHVMRSALLGDGSISKTHNAYCFADGHKINHLAYTREIKRWLGKCSIELKYWKSGFGSKMVSAISKAYKSLEFLRNQWYPNGKKKVPQDLSWMDDFTVAKWFMDDGSRAHHKGQEDRALFATNSFSEQDVKRLGAKLTEMYGVDTTTYYNKGWCLRVNSGSSYTLLKSHHFIHLFWSAIAPYIVPCMRYKLPPKYRKIKYLGRKLGVEERKAKEVKVLNIRTMISGETYFSSGMRGFDIKTSTGNYMVKGVVVHNSLGILYYSNGWPAIATRGSFASDQAKWATEWYQRLWNNTDNVFSGNRMINWPEGYTPLFEIIYKENRIVVSYDFEGLVLLGLVNIDTGFELPPEEVASWARQNGLRTPSDQTGLSLADCKSYSAPNAEGFVLQYWNQKSPIPLRIKIKTEDYVRLHKIITGLNPKGIWEHLSLGYHPDALWMPAASNQEFTRWCKGWIKTFKELYAERETQAFQAFGRASREAREDLANREQEVDKRYTRKTYAMAFSKQGQSALLPALFAMYDGKPYQPFLWKLIQPKNTQEGWFIRDADSFTGV